VRNWGRTETREGLKVTGKGGGCSREGRDPIAGCRIGLRVDGEDVSGEGNMRVWGGVE
jgi:hypothetical protein